MIKYLLLSLLFFASILSVFGQVSHVKGPAGSGSFGQSVVCFSNGNFAVSDPLYDENGNTDIGAVYIYDGVSHEVIAVLKGTTSGDRIGTYIFLLDDNLLLVYSPQWGKAKGAITVIANEAHTPIVVDESNSLVGKTSGDLASLSTQKIPNKGYVIKLSSWGGNKGAVLTRKFQEPLRGVITTESAFTGTYAGDRVGQAVLVLKEKLVIASGNYHQNRGAVTVKDWDSCVGEFSNSNSLVGERTDDQVGLMIYPLKDNEAIVVNSYRWNKERGAVTWLDLHNPLTGYISSANSLTGERISDKVGFNGVHCLKNNNYVVISSLWNEERGAVTWGSGTNGTYGVINAGNSLVGSNPLDRVGFGFVELNNGNFVTHSTAWNDITGAVTWGDGMNGIYGEVTDKNSLIGTQANDNFGGRIEPLENGDYIVINFGIPTLQGSVTWANGNSGTVGRVTAQNSLVGIATHAWLTSVNLVKLTNGNIVINFPEWNVGRGAVTFMNVGKPVVGVISAENSMIGTNEFDKIGEGGIIPLINGNYVFSSPQWANKKGAVTWVNGDTGSVGFLSEKNSMTGITVRSFDDYAGLYPLYNGNYVVHTPSFNYPEHSIVMWGNGKTGTFGEISQSNSLQMANSRIIDITPLKNGNYVINSINSLLELNAITWANGAIPLTGEISEDNSLIGQYDLMWLVPGKSPVKELITGDYIIHHPVTNNLKGLVTWASGTKGLSGLPTDKNSILGNSFEDGQKMIPVFNYQLNYLLVGRPIENLISLLYSQSELVTGLEEINTTLINTTVYPNPGADFAYIKSKSGDLLGDLSVKIMDLQGQIRQFQNGTISSTAPLQVDIRNLPSGVYILEVAGKDFCERKKLIKN